MPVSDSQQVPWPGHGIAGTLAATLAGALPGRQAPGTLLDPPEVLMSPHPMQSLTGCCLGSLAAQAWHVPALGQRGWEGGEQQ
jgi:hypothetical protein